MSKGAVGHGKTEKEVFGIKMLRPSRFKIPRTELDCCKNREDLKQSGVYFLFGTSDETRKSVVYIGQAGARKNGGGILNRLQEHKRNPEKDYWTEAVVFTTSNNSLGATEIGTCLLAAILAV